MSGLPEGWALAALSDLCKQPEQRAPHADEMFTYIDIASVDRDLKIVSEPQRLLGADAPSRARKLVEKGDVIVSMTRPNLNAVALIGEQHNGCITSTGFDVLKPIEVEPRWIFSAVRSAGFVDAMCEKVQGALYPAVKSADIREYEIPLPPLAEQTRIAQKLDELLAQVDTLKARIDAIPALLKRFRQSVLAAAVSGRLTEAWQEENEAPKPQERKIGDLFKLIDGDRGPNYPRKEDYQTSGYCLFLSTKNVRKYGFEFHEKSFLSKQKHETLRSGTLSRGDIVITTRGTLGNVASYDSSIPYEVVRINSGMLILRKIDSNFENDFFKILIASPSFQKLIDDQRSGSAQPQLPAKVIREFLVRVPSTKEQTEIVRRVEQLFAFADQLEAKVASAKSRIDHLTQSILAKAFRGELVPQDPNDEPASVLLERIKAQRAAAPKAKRGRKSA